jgi:hypothetical protein
MLVELHLTEDQVDALLGILERVEIDTGNTFSPEEEHMASRICNEITAQVGDHE